MSEITISERQAEMMMMSACIAGFCLNTAVEFDHIQDVIIFRLQEIYPSVDEVEILTASINGVRTANMFMSNMAILQEAQGGIN